MVRRILFSLLISLSTTIAQEYNFIRYFVKDGLAISQISKLNPYSDGRLLVSTFGGGFNIYDGKNFQLVNSTNGLANNNIYFSLIQNDKLLWLGTEKGLSCFDGSSIKNYFTEDGLPANLILSLTIGKDSVLWIGTGKGLAKFENGKINKIEDSLVSNVAISSLFSDSKGNLWIGLKNNLINYNFKNKRFDVKNEFSNIKNINSFSEDKNGVIWVGSNFGLYKITGEEYTLLGLDSGLSNETILSTFVDSENNLWLGTDEGLTLYRNGKFIKLGVKEGLTDYRIWTITEDAEHNIWIGSDEGLYKLNDIAFKIYKEFNGVPIDAWTIIERSDDEYWIGSDLQGVVSLKNGQFSEINTGNFKIKGLSKFFIDKNRNIWITSAKGIFRFSNNSYKNSTAEYKDIKGSISSIIQDDKGIIKFGTYSDGTIEYNGKEFKKYQNNLYGDQAIYYYLIDSQKRMWVATNSGVQIVSGDSSYIPKGFEHLTEYSFLNLIEDSYGYIWAGSYEGGLICFNSDFTEEVKFDTVSLTDGLNNNSIMATAFDDKENLWISTNGGFNRLDIKEYHRTGEKKILSYDLNDGIPGVEGYQNGMLRDSHNNLLISTIDGIVIFDPKEIKVNKRPPTIKIKNLRIMDHQFKEIVIDENTIAKLGDDFLELSYDNNNLTIEFLGISLTNPSKVKYSYKLMNNEWSNPSSEARAYLPNLPYGTYTFQVKSCNNNGIWNNEPAILNFVLIAPFWEKLWFQILTATAIFGLIFLFYLYRFNRMNSVNRDLEERIEEKIKYEAKLKKSERELRIAKEAAEKSDRLKSEFLAQMSHEIRTPINSILSYTSLLKDDIADKIDDSLKDGFTIIENSSHRLIRTIDSILNMSQLQTGNFELNNKKLNISNILNDLYNEFKNIANQKKLAFQIQLTSKECFVFGDQYTITQLIANLIDNAIKYTSKGNVTIRMLNPSEGKVVVEIMDTGIGMSEGFQKKIFDPFTQEEQGYSRKYEGTGLGLSLVQKYAALNNIKLTFNSKKDMGTTFILEFNK